jgi:protein ImuB
LPPLVSPAVPVGSENKSVPFLWLCVHLPGLAVDVFTCNGNVPLAAVESAGNRTVIRACNDAAKKYGIRADMTLAAALSLCHELKSLPRDADAECRMLNRIARAACDLSGEVSLYGNDSVVLEIRGSLALFGGLPALLRRAQAEFARAGARFVFGIAPAARAACRLAQHWPGRYVFDEPDLAAAIRQLPVEALVHDEKTLLQLRRSGIRSTGALMRLSRHGVARRFGPRVLLDLDRMLGRAPEPLPRFVPPQAFHAREEPYLPEADALRLLPPAGKLLDRLEHYLLRRQAATREVRCLLHHAAGPDTEIRLRTTRCERRSREWLHLLQRHFERTVLRAPVAALEIICRSIDVLPPENLHLLDGRGQSAQHWSRLLDQLAARLGPERLARPVLHEDHRPEYAGAKKGSGSFSATTYESDATFVAENEPDLFATRPVWLLPEPLPLPERDARPVWHGALALSPLPERIEQGWWDGFDVRRDYYRARNPAGTVLWVFRDRRNHCWYLHGIFA